MSDILFHLDERDHLVIAVAGMLISIMIWRWTASRYQGFIADELRLLLFAWLTAGMPSLGYRGYMLFWIMLFADFQSNVPPIYPEGMFILMWMLMLADQVLIKPTIILLILVWWLAYSIVFHWIRFIYREMFG